MSSVRSKKSTTTKLKKICSCCNKEKNSVEGFYLASDNLIHRDGRLGICKVCLEEVSNFNEVERFIDVLRRIDRPFIKTEYEASLPHKNPFGEYMRRIAMVQNRNLTYADSQFDEDLVKFASKNAKDLNRKFEIEEVIKFKITPDMIAKWGSGYSETDMYQLEQFYVEMRSSNDIATPQHLESLKLLCKLNLKQNKALDDGDFGAFKNLNTQYNTVLKDSGFRPIDRQSSGESSGIRTFSQIWEEIERDGFIEPYPYQEKQDIVDKTIMYMGNYTRKLLNMNSLTEPPSDTPKVEVNEDEL